MEKSKLYQIVSDYIDLNYESESTKKTYKSHANMFIYSSHPDEISRLSKKYLISYLLRYKNKGQYSMYNQYVSVLKIIYKGVLSQNKVDDVRCVKIYPKLKRLPDIIKVYNTINSIKNLKHKAILMTALKTGLRMNELISLKVSDIDRRQMKILIEQSKGGNSEFALLTNELLSLLEAYWLKYKPSNYLFEGQYGGKYSASSVNKIVKKYIGSQYSIHWLRHLAITYVINKNMPMPKVKLFSRHKSDNAVHFYYHYDDNTFNETRFLMDNIAG